jgi:chromosome segregation ATPase
MARNGIRTLAEFPEWNEAKRQLTEIQKALSDAERRAQEIHGLLAPTPGGGAGSPSEIDRRAEALLQGQEINRRLPVNSGALSMELQQLREDRLVYCRAIEMKEKEIRGLESRLSSEICKAVEPEHTRLAKKIARLARELGEANDEMCSFHRDIRDAGVSDMSLRNMEFKGAGRLSEHDSRVSYFLRECAQLGLI